MLKSCEGTYLQRWHSGVELGPVAENVVREWRFIGVATAHAVRDALLTQWTWQADVEVSHVHDWGRLECILGLIAQAELGGHIVRSLGSGECAITIHAYNYTRGNHAS